MNKDLQDIKKILTEMNTNIQIIHQRLDRLEQKIDKEVLSECKKMGSHIDFVEHVYDNVKYPLSYICNTINYNKKDTKLIDE